MDDGPPPDLKWSEKGVLHTVTLKGRLPKPIDEVRILNRIASRTAQGYEREADQRRTQLLVKGSSRLLGWAARVPGRQKTKVEAERDEEDEEEEEEALDSAGWKRCKRLSRESRLGHFYGGRPTGHGIYSE